MCRIERYNLIFPDGHIEEREQVVNTCRRGTPNAPCHRREYVQLNRDRLATQEDIEEHARNQALVIAPRSPYLEQRLQQTHQEGNTLRSRSNHRGVLGGLALEFNLRNPFSSKSKEKKMAAHRYDGPEGPVSIIERMPQAPMPPPAWEPQQRAKEKIVTIKPRQKKNGSTERKKKASSKNDKRKKTKKVVIHQIKRTSSESSSDSSSDEDESPPAPEPARVHIRPQSARSPSPATRAAETAKEARYKKEKADRDARIAEAARLARQEAQRLHEQETRHDRRRIQHEERRPLESERQRHHREVEEERARQEREDIEALRAQRARDAAVSRQPRRRPDVALHQRGDSIEESGNAFWGSALADARRRREEAETSDGYRRGEVRGGLRRRNTTDGNRRPSPRDGRGRGHERWPRYGGSG